MIQPFTVLGHFRFLRSRTVRTLATIFLVLVVLSFMLVEGWSMWQAHEVQLANARVDTSNMTRALAQHADDTIRAADIALVGVVDRLESEVMDPARVVGVSTLLRATASKMPASSALFVYDSQGRWLATSQPEMPSNVNNADREYFRYHASHSDREVHVGQPVRSRSTGRWIVPVSRRINHPDGSFAGVALATIDMGYFEEFYNSFDIGREGVILLMTGSGMLFISRPFNEAMINTDLSSGPLFQTYRTKGTEGSAVLKSRADGIERMYNYQQLAHYPLIIASALSMDDVLADWRQSTVRLLTTLTALLASLSVLGVRLIHLIAQREKTQLELHKAKAALEVLNRSLQQLTLQDSLTGLGNRRLFDTALQDEFERGRRAATPLTLIMIDVDYFKRFNDIYGHPAGDDCLRRLGQTLLDVGTRPGDAAVRYGGEELALLLPGTDAQGGVVVAERFRLAVLARAIRHTGNPEDVVTVSIGVAACLPGQDCVSAESLLESADKALYAAKAGGRNRVCNAC